MPTHENPPDACHITASFRQTFHGPNPYCAEPVILAELEFEPGAAAQGAHRCQRIAELCGDWFAPPRPPEQCGSEAAIADFLAAWTLATLNGEQGSLRMAAVFEENGKFVAAVDFHEERVSKQTLLTAVSLFNRAENASLAEVQNQLGVLRALRARFHPDYQVSFLMEAAREASIPYLPVRPERRVWQFGWGSRSENFFESQSGADSATGKMLSIDKTATKAVLRGLGVPTPVHVLVRRKRDLAKAAELIGWPCVVKPARGGRSIGVTTQITSLAQLSAAADGLLTADSLPVMIERQVPGEIFRMMVARGKVRCVVRRGVPHVTGDGRRTVRELIAARNRETAEARSKAAYLGEIPFDEECEAELQRQGVELDDVIEKGRRIPLRRIPLLSTGAIYTDVTDETHQDTCRMAEMIAAALALENCGIDFVSRDISRSFAEEGAVLEVNTTPGLRVPLMAGFDAKEIGRMIMGDRPGRIPATLLVAPEDRLESLLGSLRFDDATGWVVGANCGLGSLQFPGAPNATTPPSEATAYRLALQIVRNPLVSRIFIATALDEIVRSGLPLDRFDKIVCVDCEPAQVWETVLRNATGVYLEGMELDNALGECGIEAPQPVAAN